MSVTIPALTPMEETLYLTLSGRALDFRLPRPVLGDALADEVIRALGYDASMYRMTVSPVLGIALRAKMLDDVVRQFIARHPDTIGLDLGAGLDSRACRLDLPATVDWYDVDFPAVADARRVLLPERPHTHTIGADLTDPQWLDTVPNDRPVVIVADGLMAFLADDDAAVLMRRLADHFPSGELAFNAYTRFHMWAVKHSRRLGIADLVRSPGHDDPRYVEQWDPRVELVEELLLTRRPEVAQFPPFARFANRLASGSLAWSRRGTNILRYRF